MSILTVGIGQAFATLAGAVAASGSFDTINVLAGTYTDDFTTISHPLTINAIGGMASFVAVAPPPNHKAIMTVGADLSLNGLEFSGAAVSTGYGGNGAGIRFEAGNLSISNSWFHDNQNGILTAANPTATLTISNSEFNNNGSGTGLTHNLYVGDIASLSITGSYFHDANVGNQIKSRAEANSITNTVIADGANGNGSYSIDLPNGGQNTVTGNTLQKGPNSQNTHYVAVGEEGSVHPGSATLIGNNIFINHVGAGSSPFALLNHSGTPVTLAENTFYGFPGTHVDGSATQRDNTLLPLPAPAYDTSHPFLPQPAAVPEPMSFMLLLPMLAVMLALRRRQRRHATQPIAACIH
jgi:hypothetical protein